MNDSMDKIVKYFAAVAEQPFDYKNEWITPKPLIVSPLLLREFTCPPYCGACCPVFTLDYLPDEDKPDTVEERLVYINGKRKSIYSDLQKENKGSHCKFVRREDARCSIYEKRPFSCDFELIRVLQYKDHFRLTQQRFGRWWNMTRVDGSKGALCNLYYSPRAQGEVARKLERLRQWAEYFEIDNCIDRIIDAISILNSGKSVYFSKEGNSEIYIVE